MNNSEMLVDAMMISPIIALFFTSLIPLMIKVLRGNREPHPFSTIMYGFIGLLLASGLTAVLNGARKTAFHDAIVIDGVSNWSSYLIYLVTAAALMLAYDHVSTRGQQFSEFVFLLMNSAIGMIILLMSNDLIISFIGIETMSLCLYILVAMSKEQILSKEAAFKYFVLGSFASALFLYGIALIYGTVGSTQLPKIALETATLLATNRLFIIGFALVILGFAFKVSIFPLHAWTPDVYQGAPTPVTAFMSTAVKAATFVAFLRLFNSQGLQQAPQLLTVLQWLAVATMFIGNVAAVMQDNFKRMLAYSSVAHSGYAMIGLIAAGFGGNFQWGSTALLFYLFSYAVMTLGAFAVLALIERHENTQITMQSLKGLASKYPIVAICLSVMMLSLAGVPPTLGFFGKFYIFSAAIEQDMYWLVFWGVINSVISVYYYLRPIVMMYMHDEQPTELLTANWLTRGTAVISAIAIIVVGIFSPGVLQAVQRSVMSLF